MGTRNLLCHPPDAALQGATAPTRSKIRRLVLWIAAALFTAVLALVGALSLVCIFKPELVTATVQQQLIDATGLPWRIKGNVRPSFINGIGLVANDVRVIAASTEQGHYANAVRPLVHAASLRITVDFASLLQFTPVMELIELNEPTVNLVYDSMGRPLWLPLAPPPDEAFTVKKDTGLTLESVAGAICTPYHAAMQPVVIRKGTFVSYTHEGELFLAFTGIEGRFDPHAPENNLELSAAFTLPDADLSVSFSMAARVGCEGIPARGSLKGNLGMTPPGSRTINAEFVTSFVWDANGRDVLLPDFTLNAEGDLLSANLKADLSQGAVTGPVAIHTLSLPRWFEWARVLPPGLQNVLHSLEGGFDLDMNLDMAMARNLDARAGGLRLTGSVGAPDFSAPAVVAHLEVADTPDLDVIFPFLGVPGRWIPPLQAPVFDHPSLAPYPEEIPSPPDSGPGAVGYDINVFLKKATVHSVTGGPIKVRIAPHLVGRVEKTRVSIDGQNMLKGEVKGYLDIDANAILMRYDVTNADLALLPENQGSATRIAGRATGSCEIDMPMATDGVIKDDWPLRVDAEVKDCEITGTFRKKEWKLRIASAKAVGKGAIYAVLEKGVRLSGNWSLNASGMRTPWQSGVKDSLAGTYNGVLHWPPIFGGPPKKDAKPERKTVERVTGKVDAAGRVTLPEVLGSFALNGELTTDFDWSVTGDRLVFEGAEFKGHGGALETGVEIDLSGAQSIMRASPSFTANPSRLLRDWNIAIPKGLRVPGLLTGRLDLLMKGDSLSLDKLKVEMDGAPITGSINLVPAPKGSPDVSDTWVLRLAAQHLDIEKILPPKPQGDKTPPSKTPWKLDFFQKLSLDAQISLYNAKKGKLSFDRSNITALAQRDRFSMECDTRDFYGGTSLIIIQGTVVPGSSHVTLRKGLVHMQNVSLGGLLHDMTGKQSYAGTAELVADLKGVLGCNADIPGKLSGNWSLNIKDGMYPGFLTSEDSTLRNTFSLAKASGPMENGVLRSGNFTLSGAMVDMAGAGWYDLRNNNMDFEVSVTFAKIPTVPVRFYGNAASPHMKVRGVDMVVETMQAAGSTILGLVVGVLELPGRAFQGISNLFGGQSSGKKNKQAPQTMPVKPTGRR